MDEDESDFAPLVEAAASRHLPLKVIQIHEQQLHDLYEKNFILIRPDHHVCWRGDVIPRDPERIIDTVRGAS
jgi:hypothetical protein